MKSPTALGIRALPVVTMPRAIAVESGFAVESGMALSRIFGIGGGHMNESKLRLSHYDGRWKQEFEQMRSCIFDAAQGWVTAVEHVGSTAFPSSIARPNIDLVAGVVADGNFEETAEFIEGLNFQRLPNPKWIGNSKTILFLKDGHKALSYQVILTEWKGPLWYRLLRMKMWFERRPHDLKRLVQAKLHLLETQADAGEYERGKGIFFSALEDQIEASEEKQ